MLLAQQAAGSKIAFYRDGAIWVASRDREVAIVTLAAGTAPPTNLEILAACCRLVCRRHGRTNRPGLAFAGRHRDDRLVSSHRRADLERFSRSLHDPPRSAPRGVTGRVNEQN